VEQIEADTRRNFWMDAEAAQEYGLVGRIVEHANQAP
jgi:ATP-dependent Clp protease, protease subunit